MKLLSDIDVTAETAADLVTSEDFIESFRNHLILDGFQLEAFPIEEILLEFANEAGINPFKFVSKNSHCLVAGDMLYPNSDSYTTFKINNSFFKICMNKNFDIEIAPVKVRTETYIVLRSISNLLEKRNYQNKVNIAFSDYVRSMEGENFSTKDFVASLELGYIVSEDKGGFLMSTFDDKSLFNIRHHKNDDFSVTLLRIENLETVLKVEHEGDVFRLVWDGEKGKWDRLF